MIEVIVKYHGNLDKIKIDLDADIENLYYNYAIITLDENKVDSLYNYKEIEYVELPKLMYFSLYNNLLNSCISKIHTYENIHLTGKGTIVGIIDSGIDYTHPDFINSDGTSRILSIWDQSINGNPPEGFKNGSEYLNQNINLALESPNPYSIVPSKDILGHGTAVAGIAAGNGRQSNSREQGVAPDSSLVIVKLGSYDQEGYSRSTEIMRGIKYISDFAERLEIPCAINISYGTNNGSHDGGSLFESYISQMSEKWKTVIVVPTGNEGSSGHHYSHKLKQNEEHIIEFSVSEQLNSLYLSLWKNYVDKISYKITAPNGRSTGMLSTNIGNQRINLGDSELTVKINQPNNYTVKEEIFIYLTGNFVDSGIWNLTIYGDKIVDGYFNIWLPTVEEVSKETAFLSPTFDLTMTIPSTSKKVIAVGGYSDETGILSDFSGRGSNIPDFYNIPDLVAPANEIYTTKTNGGYDIYTGTSMAAPFVTGTSALLMEWGVVRKNDLFLYGQKVKAILHDNANRSNNLSYPNILWGYGSLSLCNLINYL